MTRKALVGIAETADAEDFESSWWFEPFGLDAPTVTKSILPRAVPEAVVAVGCTANRAMIPYALAPGEPDGTLLTWPGARCGLAVLITGEDGRKALTAAWPFTTDGVEHEIQIERVLLAPGRLQAVVEGTIAEQLPVTWLDVLFPVDRAFYAEGSVHRVVLAGIAHRFSICAPSPIGITRDDPSYAFLRDLNPEAVGGDGSITINTQGIAAMFPVESGPPTLYAIQGPVKRIEKYSEELFGREMWDIRVTVARLGDENDQDVDLSIMASDIVLNGRRLPQVGDDVSGTIRLQGRIGWPNVKRG